MNLSSLQQKLFVLGGVQVTSAGLALFVGGLLLTLVAGVAARRLSHRLFQHLDFVDEGEAYALSRVAFAVVLAFGLTTSLRGLGVGVGQTLFRLGETSFSFLSLMMLTALSGMVWAAAALAGGLTESRLLGAPRFDSGLRYAGGRLIYYLVLVSGLLAVLQVVGIQLASLMVVVGALGVGIGFGLQNLVNDFVSGVVLLMERPIKVGDWVELDETRGVVSRIGARSTSVVTRDNITYIIPNGNCLREQMVNWSHSGGRIRCRVALTVAFGSDMERVRSCLLEVARTHPRVMAEPKPEVFLDRFGDSGLKLQLGVWVRPHEIGPRRLRSELNFAIDAAFRELGIIVPFPQRDLHLEKIVLQADDHLTRT